MKNLKKIKSLGKIIVALTLSLFLLTGCKGVKDKDYLKYQDKDGIYTARMTVKESSEVFELVLTLSKDKMSVVFTSPENIKDLTYESREGVTRAIWQGLEYENGQFLLPDTLFSLFSLKKEELISAKKGDRGNVLLFKDDITLTLDKNNLPLSFDCPILALDITEAKL